jgi:hypothetical protein
MHRSSHRHLWAFTLLELSITLIIISLLAGGILAARHLIRATEIQSISSEFVQYRDAAQAFRTQYRELPGDMPNADSYWPASAGNGDGDGKITRDNFSAQLEEMFLFWQHLSLAGLISGQYTGIAGAASDFHHIAGENAPAGSIKNSGWTAMELYRIGYSDAATVHYALDYGNILILGAFIPDYRAGDPIVTPQEAYSIDQKLDDGKPGAGFIIAEQWNDDCVDASTNTDFGSDYELADNRVLCGLIFREAF